MLSKEYDLNLYGSDKHTMRLTAYRLYRDFEGNLSTDYDKKFYTLVLTRADDSGIIRYLVNNDAFYDMHLVDDYTDHDEWYDFWELTSWDFMPKIREWLDNLPEYRMVDQREYKGE
jgi:hypothetical protein